MPDFGWGFHVPPYSKPSSTPDLAQALPSLATHPRCLSKSRCTMTLTKPLSLVWAFSSHPIYQFQGNNHQI